MTDEKSEPKLQEVNYYFIKSNSFRTVFCDGVFGGMRPDGNLHLTIYSERPAIPQKIVVSINSDGEVIQENKDLREGKEGIVCDVETNLVFDIDTAIELHHWLQDQLDAAVEHGLIESTDKSSSESEIKSE